MRNRYAIRKALRLTVGADDALRNAVKAAQSHLTPSASSGETLARYLASAADRAPDEGLTRRFLEHLHAEFARYTPVLWAPPAGRAGPQGWGGGGVPRGRTDEVGRVLNAIDSSVSVVIRGAPGIGKTTLLHVVHQSRPEGIFVRLEQGGMPMRDLRLALHRESGADFPMDDDQGLAIIARAYQAGGLLLIDNADEVESAAAIRRLKGVVPGLTLVVTSRAQDFDGFEILNLPPLTPTESAEVLSEFDLPAPDKARAIERAGGNPLLLRQEVFALQEGASADHADHLDAVIRRLIASDRRTVSVVGALPAATLPLPLLLEVCGLSPDGLDVMRRNAVARSSGNSLEFHQTLRAACADIVSSAPASEEQLVVDDAARYYASWLATGPPLEEIDGAFPNVMYLMTNVSEPSLTVDIALALIGDRLDDPAGYLPSHGLTGLFREQRGFLERAANTVGGVRAAQLEKNLGLFSHWGDEDDAQDLVLSARSRFQEEGDFLGEAAAIWILGIIADDSCRYESAERLYRTPLAWLEDPGTRAVGHHLVGCSLYHQGQFGEAARAFEQALAETTDPTLESRAQRRLAYVELLCGDTSAAIRDLEAIKDRAAGLNRPRDVARINRHIGEGYLRMDAAEMAERRFSDARQQFEAIGDKRGLAASLLGLAKSRRLQRSLAEAEDLAVRGRFIAAGRGSDLLHPYVSPVGVARAEEELGRIELERDNRGPALSHLRHACNIFEVIGHASGLALIEELGPDRNAQLPACKGIVFDLVDTLAETSAVQYESTKERMSETLGVDHDRFKAVWARSRTRASTDSTWTARDRIAWVADQLDATVPPHTLDELAEAERRLWSVSIHLKPGVIESLAYLVEHGIKLGLTSNGTSAMRHLPATLGLDHLLTSSVVSSEIGILKPHAGIYRRALDQMGLTPGECLYVGDGSDRELEGAQAVGLFAVRLLVPEVPKYSTQHSLNWDATVASVAELTSRLEL